MVQVDPLGRVKVKLDVELATQHFPHYGTLKTQRSPAQINLLSNLTAWTVLQNSAAFTRAVLQLSRSATRTAVTQGLGARGVRRGEVRQLIGVRLPECGPLRDACHIGFGRGSISESADFCDAEDVGHQQIRDREAIGGQPFPLRQDPFSIWPRRLSSQPVR